MLSLSGSKIYNLQMDTSDTDFFAITENKDIYIPSIPNTDIWAINRKDLITYLMEGETVDIRFPFHSAEIMIFNALFCDFGTLVSSDMWNECQKHKDKFLSRRIINRIVSNFKTLPTKKRRKHASIRMAFMLMAIDYSKTKTVNYVSDVPLKIKNGEIVDYDSVYKDTFHKFSEELTNIDITEDDFKGWISILSN